METTQLTCPPRSRHLLLLSKFMYRAYPTLRCRTRTKQGVRDLATHFRRPRRECCDRPGTAAVLMFLGMFVCKTGSTADKTCIRCGFLPVSNPWRPMGANGSFARRTSGRRADLPKFLPGFKLGAVLTRLRWEGVLSAHNLPAPRNLSLALSFELVAFSHSWGILRPSRLFTNWKCSLRRYRITGGFRDLEGPKTKGKAEPSSLSSTTTILTPHLLEIASNVNPQSH